MLKRFDQKNNNNDKKITIQTFLRIIIEKVESYKCVCI